MRASNCWSPRGRNLLHIAKEFHPFSLAWCHLLACSQHRSHTIQSHPQSQVQPLHLLPLTLDFSRSSTPFIVASSGSSSLRGLSQRCALHRSTWGDYTTDYLRSAANFTTSRKLHILVHELKCTSTSANSRRPTRYYKCIDALGSKTAKKCHSIPNILRHFLGCPGIPLPWPCRLHSSTKLLVGCPKDFLDVFSGNQIHSCSPRS